jgi:hypothetical protein
MNPLIVQDIFNQLNDYLGNYTTGTVDIGRRMRAINRAVEYAKRRMTLPSDETTSSFWFSRDQLYYTAPTDVNEPINLLYADANNNTPRTQWNWIPYPDLLRLTGTGRSNFWSHATINGYLQILMLGYNLTTGSILETFTMLPGFNGQNDATALTIDNNVYSVAPGSLEFTIDPTLGHGLASIEWGVQWDITTLHQKQGIIKLDAYLPSLALTSINLVLGTDALNYYTFTCTDTDNGTAFVVNNFNRLHWTFLASAAPVIVGSPNDQNITYARVDFIQSGAFGSSPISGFRIDNMYSVFPDEMTFIYNTKYKGTDTLGTTQLINFTSSSDIPAFGQYAPDLLDPIALRAAWILEPQLRGDKDFMKTYFDECEERLKDFGHIYPRKRIINYGQTWIQRP